MCALINPHMDLPVRDVAETMLFPKSGAAAPFNPVLPGLLGSVIFNFSPSRTPRSFSPTDFLALSSPYFKSN